MVIGIVGLGLIGGSIGLALQNTKIVKKVVGYDLNISHCDEALNLKLVHEIVNFEDIKHCDVIILAIPVEAIILTLQKLTDIPKTTTIIDLGSTKNLIVKNVPNKIRKNFIAAHPMAGTEKFGPSAALKNLFDGQIVVFCDIEESGDTHIIRATQIFSHIGMKIVFMNSEKHDKHASYISHLPHAISYALANSVMHQENPKSILLLAGGGFRDMSRVAKSSPIMWSDIFKQNKDNLVQSIDKFELELAKCKEFIKNEKWSELEEWMKNATTLHQIL